MNGTFEWAPVVKSNAKATPKSIHDISAKLLVRVRGQAHVPDRPIQWSGDLTESPGHRWAGVPAAVQVLQILHVLVPTYSGGACMQ